MRKNNLWHYKLIVLLISLLTTVTILAEEATTYSVNLQDYGPQVSRTNALEKEPFDAKKYNIAYDAFVYSGRPKDAFLIAESAYRQTGLLIWEERLAQSALWSGKVYLALDTYLDLIFNQHQKQYLDQTIKLAQSINAHDYLIQLYQHKLETESKTAVVLNALAKAYNGVGDTDKALNYYNQAFSLNPDITSLEEIYKIQYDTSRYDDANETLRKIEKRYGVTAKTALKRASIHYRQMDVEGALRTLKRIPNRDAIEDVQYWQDMATLSWIVGDFNEAKKAYYHLYVLNAINYEQLQHYLRLFPENSPQKMRIVMNAWQRFHQPDLYMMVIDNALESQSWQLLEKMYAYPLNSRDRTLLEKEPNYWRGQAALIQHAGFPKPARLFLLQALLDRPNNEALQFVYLDFLLTQLSVVLPEQEPIYLKKGLQYYVNKWDKNYDFRGVYAYALSLFDYLKQSLYIFETSKPDHSNIHDWYYRYSYALDDVFHWKDAYDMRLATWKSMQLLVKDQTPDSYNFWVPYNGIAAKFAPAQINYPLSLYMAEHFKYPAAADGLMTWAIDHNQYDVMVYLKNYYYVSGIPTWAALRIAILQNDQVKINQIISTMPPAVPRKDLVTGARQINALPHAQTFAFENVGRSSDYERYDQLTETMLETANQIKAASEYEIFGAMQGPREKFEGIFFIDYKWSVKPYITFWRSQTNNDEVLPDKSYIENIGGIALQRQTNRNHFYIDIGERRSLYNHFFARLFGEHIVTSRLTVSGWLGYNNRSTLTENMLLAGSQDEAVINLNYQLTPRDQVVGALQLYRYYLQNREFLGTGQTYYGSIHHKFWLSYPDYFIGLIGNINRYQARNKIITGRANTIFVDQTIPHTASEFLTDNFWETDLEVGFGNDIRDNYTHDWRPFALAGLSYNSVSGNGYYFDAGIAGMVFGRDKLMFYGNYSKNSAGLVSKNYLFGVQYQIYF